MAALTGRHGVGSKQGEPRPGVFGNQAGRPPTGLLMAALTIQPERGRMRVRVASPASPGGIELYRTAIVVAAQAGRPGVRACERMTGDLLVVEREILAEDVPSLRHVAQAAIPGKRLVRHERPPPAAPTLPRGIQPTIEQRPRRQRREKPDEQFLGTPVVQPHHACHANCRMRLFRVRELHPNVPSHRAG